MRRSSPSLPAFISFIPVPILTDDFRRRGATRLLHAPGMLESVSSFSTEELNEIAGNRHHDCRPAVRRAKSTSHRLQVMMSASRNVPLSCHVTPEIFVATFLSFHGTISGKSLVVVAPTWQYSAHIEVPDVKPAPYYGQRGSVIHVLFASSAGSASICRSTIVCTYST